MVFVDLLALDVGEDTTTPGPDTCFLEGLPFTSANCCVALSGPCLTEVEQFADAEEGDVVFRFDF